MSDTRVDIWRLQAQNDVEGLIKALSHEDASIRKRAAVALRAISAISAIPALTAAMSQETDPEARSHIATALDDLTTDEAIKDETHEKPDPQSRVALLIGALGSKQQEQVMAAVRELGEMQDKLAVVPLVMLFNNSVTPIKVRLAVAETLLKLNSAPVEVSLLGALRSHDWQKRRNAAAILGQLRAEWAIEPLGRALADPHEHVRRTAHAALKHIGTSDALKQLAMPRKIAPTKQTGEAMKVSPLQSDESGKQTASPAAGESAKSAPPAKPTLTGSKEGLAAALNSALGQKPKSPTSTPEQKPESPKPQEVNATSETAAPTEAVPAQETPVLVPPAPIVTETMAKVETAPTDPTQPVIEEKRKTGLLARITTGSLPIIKPADTSETEQPAAESAVESPAPNPATATSTSETLAADGSRLAWPKRKSSEMPSLAPTRPLDPSTLDNARKRLKQSLKKHDDQSEA